MVVSPRSALEQDRERARQRESHCDSLCRVRSLSCSNASTKSDQSLRIAFRITKDLRFFRRTAVSDQTAWMFDLSLMDAHDSHMVYAQVSSGEEKRSTKLLKT